MVYGLLILQSGFPLADELYHLVALVTAASIVAHSSTDVVIARVLREEQEELEDRAERTTGERPGQ